VGLDFLVQRKEIASRAMKEIKVPLIFPKWEHADDIYRIFTRDLFRGMYHRLFTG